MKGLATRQALTNPNPNPNPNPNREIKHSHD